MLPLPSYVSQSHVLLGSPLQLVSGMHALLVLWCLLECYYLCHSRLNA
uniref:Uncharacterized protein n=1 Tax=Arundo donax TaxID=35708 RepID=A0A0A9AG29_ARUDO